MFNFSRTMFPLWVWFVGFLIIFLSAVVLWFIWTYLEIGRNYFVFFARTITSTQFLGGFRHIDMFVDRGWNRFRLI